MEALDRLVPGFTHAMEDAPGRAATARVLEESLQDGILSARTAAIIRVAVAQRVGGPYARWAMARIAAHQFVNGEDVFLASACAAHDPVENAIVRAAARMAQSGRRTHPSEFDALAHLLGEQRAAEVVAQVALTMLACEALAAIAPSTGSTSAPSRKGAQQ